MLLKLSEQVAFSSKIRPACLHQTSHINAPKAVATGWGSTELAGPNSEKLLKVGLNILDNGMCQQTFRGDSEIVINDNQMCAGILEGGKDTCQGGE